MNQFQQYIHLSRYARWLPSEKRRESWAETVLRYANFFQEKYPEIFPTEKVIHSIMQMEVMPSMRALMTAGPALERDNIAGYNCSYGPIRKLRDFDRIMYILMCGTGVGFSVERQNIQQLPIISEEFHETSTTIVVADSKIGWAAACRELIALLYAGQIPQWDTTRVRPAGSRLRVFGGRASGPEPLDELFRFLVQTIKAAAGRRLTSLEVHDIVCKIADVVVVGGVRRSALISLSNLTDERMRLAKSGEWWKDNVQRALANNSVAYTEKPDVPIFIREWLELYNSKSGERGIFNRVAATEAVRATGRRDPGYDFGTNPCGEIILRPYGLCNLSEVVIRAEDSKEDLLRKVEMATILGTFQATLTNFRYLDHEWTKNAEEERLLGVSLTGIMDHPILSKVSAEAVELLKEMKEHAIRTNEYWAGRIGINVSAAITTVKPSGTVSQLVDSSSGIHPRYSEYYIRTVRADSKDPLAIFMKEQGFPWEPDVTKPDATVVFSFPVKAPHGGVFRNDMTAIEQLEHYLMFKKYWCEHNPSITVYVREHEWIDVQAWVYRHFNELGGVSFLPHSDHIYKQAPYQEITKEMYEEFLARMPENVDWTQLVEEHDDTTASQELACMAGVCEVV